MRCTNFASHMPLNPNIHKAKNAQVGKHEGVFWCQNYEIRNDCCQLLILHQCIQVLRSDSWCWSTLKLKKVTPLARNRQIQNQTMFG